MGCELYKETIDPYHVYYYSQVTSTNDVISSLVKEDPSLKVAVVADSQSNGRGSRGRQWQSPLGNLYLSLYNPSFGILKTLPLIIGLAIKSAIEGIRPMISIKLKWPNDILIASSLKKVGGVLAEKIEGRTIAGIGINLCNSPDYADNLRNYHPDRNSLVAEILKKIEHYNFVALTLGFSSLRREWIDSSIYKPGDIIQVDDERGLFGGLGLDGMIIIDHEKVNEKV